MKAGMSKREKILIFIAITVGLVMLAYTYVLLPMYLGYARLQEDLDSAIHERTMLEAMFQTEDALIRHNDIALGDFEEITAKYPPVMLNNQIDDILTDMCVRYNFTPVLLTMPAIPIPLMHGTSEGDEPAFGVIPAEMRLIPTYSAYSYNDLLSLINEIERYDYIRITALRYERHDRPQILGDLTFRDEIKITFEVTMLYYE
ncbi:MAG: hypothetical protein FWH00_04120 [Oscillospiraceae bacterium]|nr:hypothetical protein [Oscillospiraceae bacterium]